jgi:hypothetical protein
LKGVGDDQDGRNNIFFNYAFLLFGSPFYFLLFGSSTPEAPGWGVPLRREPRAKEGEWNSPAKCFRSRTPEEQGTQKEQRSKVEQMKEVDDHDSRNGMNLG